MEVLCKPFRRKLNYKKNVEVDEGSPNEKYTWTCWTTVLVVINVVSYLPSNEFAYSRCGPFHRRQRQRQFKKCQFILRWDKISFLAHSRCILNLKYNKMDIMFSWVSSPGTRRINLMIFHTRVSVWRLN